MRVRIVYAGTCTNYYVHVHPNTKYASFLCIFESCFTCFGLLGWAYDFQAWNWTAGTSGDSQRAAGCQQIKKYAILDRLSVFLNCSNLHFQQAYLQTNGMDILRWLKWFQKEVDNQPTNGLSQININVDDVLQAVRLGLLIFSELVNSELEKSNRDIDVETVFKKKIIRANQLAENVKDKFRVNVRNMVMDQVISSLL